MSKHQEIKKRVLEEATYVIKTNSTVRATAKQFQVSKSTVHLDITVRLFYINPELFKKVNEILQKHTDECHIRGGNATREKYLKLRNSKQ